MQSIIPRLRCALGPIAALGAVLALSAFPIGAAAATYPAGGSSFGSDAEGWQATEAECNIALAGLCTAGGGHDSAVGNPAGSLAAEASVAVNLGGLFDAAVVLESPDFVLAEAGSASVQLDRQFEPGGLGALAPEATYTVALVDRATETPVEVLIETLDEDDSAFASKEASASVAAGHTYALVIEVEIGSTTASIGLLGDAIVRFDNVALSVEEQGGGGSGGGNGGSGGGGGEALSTTELLTSVRRETQETAVVRGNRVFVRVACPRRVGRACRISAQGMIGRRLRVTRRSTVRVASGRARLVGLRVKPRFRDRVAARKRLLIVQRVRAGKVSATFARTRVLVRRG